MDNFVYISIYGILGVEKERAMLEKLAQLQKDLEELAKRIEEFKKLLENAARK